MIAYLSILASFLLQLVVAVIALLIYACLVGVAVYTFMYVGVHLFRRTHGRWILCTAHSRD
jgi:hypothetical protein